MFNYIRYALCILLAAMHCFNAKGQQDSTYTALVIGKKCPDFTLNDVENFSKPTASLRDFEGQWLIMDFWNQYCTACVESFPHSNEMQKKFENKARYVLVGLQDKMKRIQTIYERFRQQDSLNLTVDFDSAIFKQFDIGPCPYIIVLDEKGIVRAITTSLDEQGLNALMKGEIPVLTRGMNNQQVSEFIEEGRKPLDKKDASEYDSTLLFHSSLNRWQPGTGYGFTDHIDSRFKNAVQLKFANLRLLYLLAYQDTISPLPFEDINSYGKISIDPVLEMKDSSRFKYDAASGKNLFNYSLVVERKRGKPKFLQECLQKDLHAAFGFKVTVETRRMPYWKLTATAHAKKTLPTGRPIDSTTNSPGSSIGLDYTNVPIKFLIRAIFEYYQKYPPFIDETGIRGNINLKIDAVMNNFTELKRALHHKGLDLIKGEKMMKVIVIRDP